MANDGPNAVELLRQQHEAIREIFRTLESGKGHRALLFQSLVRVLSMHETAEEMIIWPAVRGNRSEGGDIADARIAEEDLAKSRLAELERLGVDAPGFDDRLRQFRELVLQHAEHEEATAFPLLERTQDPGRLRTMGTAIQAAEMVAPTHPHPSGPDSAVGNIVLGPAIAVVDRTRDAIRSALGGS